MVEIHSAFKSKGLYRNEASTVLSKAVEILIDTLQKLSPTSKNQHSLFQATPEGPITSWSVGSQHIQTQSVPISKTKTYQENHMVTASLVVNIRDFDGQLILLERLASENSFSTCRCVSQTSYRNAQCLRQEEECPLRVVMRVALPGLMFYLQGTVHFDGYDVNWTWFGNSQEGYPSVPTAIISQCASTAILQL